MKNHPILSLLLIGSLCFAAGVREAKAVILVYKVTASVKAYNFPRTSSVVSGYLFFDTANSNNSQTVETFRDKTYTQNGLLFLLLQPQSFALAAFDSNNDPNHLPDLIAPLIGLQTQTFTDARAIRGVVPPLGFRFPGSITEFRGVSKSLRGIGSRVVNNSDLLTRTDVFTIDVLTAALPNTTEVAKNNIIGRLANQHYIERH